VKLFTAFWNLRNVGENNILAAGLLPGVSTERWPLDMPPCVWLTRMVTIGSLSGRPSAGSPSSFRIPTTDRTTGELAEIRAQGARRR
jgi:hypothetical protein